MLDWFAGAVESAKTVVSVSQSLLTLRDEEMVRNRVFEITNSVMNLQQQLMNAQLQQMELIKRIQELESEKAARDGAQKNITRFRLHTFPTGHSAFVEADSDVSDSSTRFFCSRCLETQDKAVTLQGRVSLTCPECKIRIRKVPTDTNRFRANPRPLW